MTIMTSLFSAQGLLSEHVPTSKLLRPRDIWTSNFTIRLESRKQLSTGLFDDAVLITDLPLSGKNKLRQTNSRRWRRIEWNKRKDVGMRCAVTLIYARWHSSWSYSIGSFTEPCKEAVVPEGRISVSPVKMQPASLKCLQSCELFSRRNSGW
jgi:hypothetical protein